MRHHWGANERHGPALELSRARDDVRQRLAEQDLVGALRTVRGEVVPLAEKIAGTDPETLAGQRDSVAVLLNDCALCLMDGVARATPDSFDALTVRRVDPRDIDGLLDAGRPGERPAVPRLFDKALTFAADPVLREVIRGNQLAARILRHVNRRLQTLTDAV